jgi:hypothetical protein
MAGVLFSEVVVAQTGARSAHSTWYFSVPPAADRWWNGLSQFKRIGVLLGAIVVYLVGMRFAKVFLSFTILYFLGSLFVAFDTKNLFWVLQGGVVLITGIMTMGFNRMYSGQME